MDFPSQFHLAPSQEIIYIIQCFDNYSPLRLSNSSEAVSVSIQEYPQYACPVNQPKWNDDERRSCAKLYQCGARHFSLSSPGSTESIPMKDYDKLHQKSQNYWRGFHVVAQSRKNAPLREVKDVHISVCISEAVHSIVIW